MVIRPPFDIGPSNGGLRYEAFAVVCIYVSCLNFAMRSAGHIS